MKNNFRRYNKYLYTLPLLSSLFMYSDAFAQISPRAFKGISPYFREGKKYVDPTLGKTALETGLIHNFRFYGNIEPSYDQNGVRVDYINDKALDPMASLVKVLFPSPVGHLAVETTADNSFGKFVRDPRTVAHLLNFADDIRTFLKERHDLLQKKKAHNEISKETLEKIKILQKEMKEIEASLKNYRKDIENVKILPSLTKEERNQRIKDLSDQKNAIEKTLQTKKRLKDSLSQEAKQETEGFDRIEKETRQSFEKKKETWFSTIMESLDNTKSDEKVHPILNGLLSSIELSLEQEEKAPYAQYTTEQVLTAFLCEKFNTREDLRTFIDSLKENIVDKSLPLPDPEDYLKEEDLESLSRKETLYEYDDIFSLANAWFFRLITPYKPGVHLLSNGNTYPFDRKNNTLLKSKKLTDCAEMAIRHFLNLVLFNPETKEFDLTPILTYIQEKNSKNPYFENFLSFYKRQNLDLANAGDIDMRSFWNTVLGDLNADNEGDAGSQINYKRGTNEVRSGFINFVNICRKVFGLKIADLSAQSDFQEKKLWLEKAFKSLLTVLNPGKTYEVDFDTLQETGFELSGTLPLTVSDETGEALFSFDFYMEYGVHSEVKNLKILRKSPFDLDYTQNLLTHPHGIQKHTTDESLWLLSLNDNTLNNVFPKINNLLYMIFLKPLADNKSRIFALQALNYKISQSGQEDLNYSFIGKILSNILRKVSWEDRPVLEKVSSVICDLMRFKDLHPSLISHVKGLYLNKSDTVLFPELMKMDHLTALWPHIKILHLGQDTSNLLENGISTFSSLENLHVLATKVYTLNVSTLKNLKILDLSESESLKSLFLDNPFLEVLHLGRCSSLSVLEGMNRSVNLKSLCLDLKKISSKEKISLKNHPILENLYVSHLPVDELQNLKILKNLKNLSLKHIQGKNLSLEGNPLLEDLDISFSSIKELCNLETASNLKNLKLEDTRVKQLSLKNKTLMEKVGIYNSPITELQDVATVKNLKILELVNTNVRELVLDNPFLEQLSLIGSSIKKLKNLSGSKNLIYLNLSSCQLLQEIEFTEENRNVKIFLTGSLITRKDQIKGIEYLDQDNITW